MKEKLEQKTLLSKIQELILSYKPEIETIEIFWVKIQNEKQYKLLREAFEKEEVYWVLRGLERYSAALQELTENFYIIFRGELSRKDKLKYLILLFLLTFGNFPLKGDEVKISDIFVLNQFKTISKEKIAMFDKYVKHESFTHIISKTFDSNISMSFVNNINQLDISNLNKDLNLKAIAVSKSKGKTEPCPFNLSKNKKKSSKFTKHEEKKIIAANSKKKYKQTNLEEIKKLRFASKNLNLQVLKVKYENFPKINLDLLKRNDMRKLKEKNEKRIEKAIEQLRYTNDIPNFEQKHFEYSETLTSMKREDYLFEKRREKEYFEIKRYEAELKDMKIFITWQEKMKSKDIEKQKKMIEIRKKKAEESFIKAKQSVKKCVEVRKEEAKRQKEIHNIVLLEEKKNNETRKKNNSEKAKILLLQNKENILNSKKLLLEQKRKHKKMIDLTTKNGIKNEKERESTALKKKKDIVRKIKAFEKTLTKSKIKFDPTYVPNHGLLDQKSYFEVKKQLVYLEEKYAIQLKSKQDNIFIKKEEDKKKYEELKSNIKRARRARKKQNEKLKNNKKLSKLCDENRKKRQNRITRNEIIKRLDEKNLKKNEIEKNNKIQAKNNKKKLKEKQEKENQKLIINQNKLCKEMENKVKQEQIKQREKIRNIERLKFRKQNQIRINLNKSKKN